MAISRTTQAKTGVIIVDGDGLIHIAYCDMCRQVEGSERGLLCYARIGNDGVSRQFLDQGKPMSCGVYPSLASGPAGRMAVSYQYDTTGGRDRNQEVIKVAILEGAE